MNYIITTEQLTKKYKNFVSVNKVFLHIRKGSIYGFLGPNGAGKTTLIKMLTTLLFPTSGHICWKGEDIYALDEVYRGHLGYLPQEFGFYPNYTPRQFLRYAAALQCLPKRQVEERLNQLLELVGLDEVKNKKMRQFSGGMLRRVGIAQAMLNNPHILILDEPTTGLDPKERVRFRNLIHSLAANRIVILSTHIVSDIETIAGQIIMLKNHRVFCCDSPLAISAQFQGKIFEIPASNNKPEYFLLSERQGENGPLMRIMSDTPPNDAVAVTPGLEDAFLAIFRDDNK